MPRELTNPQAQAFLLRHPELATEWTIDYDGIGVRDGERWILVMRGLGDQKLHFVDVTDMPQYAIAANKPDYHTPEESVFHNAVQIVQRGIDRAGQIGRGAADWIPMVLGLTAVIAIANAAAAAKR